MFPVPQNGFCSAVPFSFRFLFPCAPEINGLIPLFPKPLGGPHFRNPGLNRLTSLCIVYPLFPINTYTKANSVHESKQCTRKQTGSHKCCRPSQKWRKMYQVYPVHLNINYKNANSFCNCPLFWSNHKCPI